MAENKEQFKDAARANPEKFVQIPTAAPLTVEQLMKMLVDSQAQAAEANSKLADALLESRKPYVDPKVLEAKRQENEDRRKQIELEMKRRAYTKKYCTHRRESNNTLNIKWHQHSNGIILGVCGTCRSEFDAKNPEDRALLLQDMKAIKNMGRAGAHAALGVMVEA